ncbi:hypothetical protein BGZ94_005562, partial [Podila epigama]
SHGSSRLRLGIISILWCIGVEARLKAAAAANDVFDKNDSYRLTSSHSGKSRPTTFSSSNSKRKQ